MAINPNWLMSSYGCLRLFQIIFAAVVLSLAATDNRTFNKHNFSCNESHIGNAENIAIIVSATALGVILILVALNVVEINYSFGYRFMIVDGIFDTLFALAYLVSSIYLLVVATCYAELCAAAAIGLGAAMFHFITSIICMRAIPVRSTSTAVATEAPIG